jgi:hypothetical protein
MEAFLAPARFEVADGLRLNACIALLLVFKIHLNVTPACPFVFLLVFVNISASWVSGKVGGRQVNTNIKQDGTN